MEPQMQMEMVSQALPMWVIPIYIVAYVFFAFCLAKLAVRVGLAFGNSFILALIPIANIYLMFKMSGKPGWWTIMAFIPVVNLVFFIMAWIAYLEKIGKPAWWVILLFIPFVNLVVFLMLVFGKNASAAA